MATKRSAVRGRKQNQNHGKIELLSKLQFIAQAQKKDAGDYSSHCVISGQTINAFDGCFAIGARIAEDFEACPHTHSMIAALSKCGETVGIVSEGNNVSVVSDKLTVRIQCAPFGTMPRIMPDPNIAPIDERIREGFRVVGVLSKEGEARLPLATLLLEANIVSATNGYALMQFRHGNDLPPGLIVPKRFADLVNKHPAKLIGFGWTPETSITFWFDDETYIKTLLQRGAWPDLSPVINKDSNPFPLPDGFADAVETVSDFSSTGIIEFRPGSINSDPNKATCASVEIDMPNPKLMYNGKTLTAILPNIQSADLTGYEDRIFFFGCEGNMRGVIMGMKPKA